MHLAKVNVESSSLFARSIEGPGNPVAFSEGFGGEDLHADQAKGPGRRRHRLAPVAGGSLASGFCPEPRGPWRGWAASSFIAPMPHPRTFSPGTPPSRWCCHSSCCSCSAPAAKRRPNGSGRRCATIRSMRPLSAIGVLVVSITTACGDGGSGSTVACTLGSGTTKMCVEYSGLAGEAVQGQRDACTSAGGAASSTCPHLGADGGCQVKSTTAGGSQTVTTWLYTGNADTEKMACASNGQTWIAP